MSVLTYQPERQIGPAQEPRSYRAAFVILLAFYCIWVLSLPVFPTQDGAMHLYYVHALHQLAAGNSAFSNSYALRIPLPPYTVQYAVLYALTSVIDAAWAEKIMVCLILIVTATGFRALARSIGETGAIVSLWTFPVILGWAVFMGFHNFCLSLGLSLWALAFWMRAATGRRRYFVLFGCSVVVVEFTHPVPLLMMVVCLVVDMCVRLFAVRATEGLSWRKSAGSLRLEWVAAGAAVSSLAYLALFINSGHTVTAVPVHVSRAAWLKQIVLLQHMCFGSGGVSTKLYRFILGACFLFFFWLGWKRFKSGWISRRLEPASTMLLCAAGLALLLPLLPSRVNGLDYFRERLVIYLFVFAFASASAFRGLSSRARTVLYGGALVFAGFDLAMAERLIRPVSRDVAQLEKVTWGVGSRAGLLVNAARMVGSRRLTGNPYHLWNGARFFRGADAVMLNDPWAGAPNILPINRTSGPRLNSHLSNFELLNPMQLRAELLQSKEARDRILATTDLIFFVGLPQTALRVDPLLELSGRAWTCHQGSWFFYCEANSHAMKTTVAPIRALAGQPTGEGAFKELNPAEKRFGISE